MSIEACGGEPFGTWRATAVEMSEFEFRITNSNGGSVTCEGFVESTSGGEYLVEFADGGTGKIFHQAPDAVVLFLSSCLDRGGVYCESSDEYDCESVECGLCRCSFEGSSKVSDTTWARDESTLTVHTPDTTDELAYCVTDGRMAQVNESGNLRYSLEKVYLAGAPQPCADRTKESCPGAGCSRGLCTGTGDCDSAYTETSCLQHQGCSWDADVCHGTAAATCEFGDYVRKLPGCEISTAATPACTGTPGACEDQPDCAAAGCGIGAGCTGGAQECTVDDVGVPGCECEGQECVGTYHCADITDQDVCSYAGLNHACGWSTEVCAGTPTACSELTNEECEQTQGCLLQAE